MRRSPCSWPARGRIGDRGVERRRKESPDEARRDPYPPCGWENRAECVSLGRVLRFSSDHREGRGFPPCCANLKANLAKRESNCVPLLRLRQSKAFSTGSAFSASGTRPPHPSPVPRPVRAPGTAWSTDASTCTSNNGNANIILLSFRLLRPRRHEN